MVPENKKLLDSHKGLIKQLRRGHFSVRELAEILNYNEQGIRGRISDLKKLNFDIKQNRHNGATFYYLPTQAIPDQKVIVDHAGSKVYKVAVISDTHLCSKTEALDELKTFYKFARAKGVRELLHSGDIGDGSGVYPGHENELKVWGLDEQEQYIVDNYPKVQGCKTMFVTGNHDLKAFQREGRDYGHSIAQKRKDMIYLGQYEADINFEKAKLRLVHPDGSIPYSVSYRIQKYIEAISGGEKPNILCYGHLHQAYYMHYRNIHSLGAGCFQKQNNFLRRKGIQPQIGGWILEFRIKNGFEINDLKLEWKVFY